MKSEKITLTTIEKEKLLSIIGVTAKNFELKRLSIEEALGEIEKEGGRDDRLLALLDRYRDRQSFFEMLEQKVTQAIDHNQI